MSTAKFKQCRLTPEREEKVRGREEERGTEGVRERDLLLPPLLSWRFTAKRTANLLKLYFS